jgi:glycosyltransferase involved in cell wall biosynthesis
VRIAFDAQLSVGTATGIGEYAMGLLAALRDRGCDIVELREPGLDPWRFDRRVLWDQVLLPSRAHRTGAALLHCPGGTMPWNAGMPVVVTVHDLAWLRVQRHARAYARWYFGRFALARYSSAAAIVADSEFSANELREAMPHCEKPVRVVYPGVSHDFCAVERAGGDGRTILAVGTVEPRKNLALLVRLLPRWPQARLVSVGPLTPYADECIALAERLGVAERVKLCGYVARDEVLELYRIAALAAVPSIYEGFGYAAAQALCAGLPCVVSDRSSLPEVAGGDAEVAPLEDDERWTVAVHTALDGLRDVPAAQARARSAARFSWAAAATAMEEVYRAAIAGA